MAALGEVHLMWNLEKVYMEFSNEETTKLESYYLPYVCVMS